MCCDLQVDNYYLKERDHITVYLQCPGQGLVAGIQGALAIRQTMYTGVTILCQYLYLLRANSSNTELFFFFLIF